MEVLTRYLAEHEALCRSDQGVAVRSYPNVNPVFPTSCRHLMALALDELDENETAVARAMSVGLHLDLETITALSGLSTDAVTTCLESLALRGIVRRVEGGSKWGVAHTQWRSAISARAGRGALTEPHRRLAGLLATRTDGEHGEAQISRAVAWHSYCAGDASQALRYALASAESLARGGQAESAEEMVRVAEDCMAVLGSACTTRIADLKALADTCWRIGRVSDAARLYRELVVEVRESDASDADLVELECLYSRAAALSGDSSSAQAALDRAAEAIASMDASTWHARVSSAMGIVHQMRGEFTEVERLAKSSIERLGSDARPDLLAACHNSLGNSLLARSMWADASREFRLAASLAERSGATHLQALAHANLGLSELYSGDWPQAERNLQHSIGLARRLGSAYCLHVSLGAMGLLRLRQGFLDDAWVLLMQAHDFAERSGDPWGMSVSLMNAAEFQQASGDHRAALDLLSQAENIMVSKGCHDDVAELHRRKSECLFEISQYAAAAAEAKLAAEWAEDTGNALEAASAEALIICCGAATGRPWQAETDGVDVVRRLRRLGASYDAARAGVFMGRAAMLLGNGDGAMRFLDDARASFSDLGARRSARQAAEQMDVAAGLSPSTSSELPRDIDFLSGLYSVSRTLALAENPGSIAREVVDVIASRLPVDYVVAGILESEGGITSASSRSPSSETARDDSFVSCALPQLLASGLTGPSRIRTEHADAALAPLLKERSVSEMLYCPMVSKERLVGGLCLEYHQCDRHFTPEECSFVHALAAQAATAVDNAVLRAQLREEVEYLRWEVDGRFSFANIIGRSLPMQKLFSVLQRVARTSATVLIQGESGTGKELVAKA
ncbi:MAG: GAF domain-containing protein, partial [Armatimonadetes bacterium]|nr:GAF domain-containing protein [Armatimonadota bacterium]